MQIKLFHKLFGTLFLTSLAIVVTMMATTSINLSDNFTRYLIRVQLKKHKLKPILTTYYKKNGSWDRFKNNRRTWEFFILQKVINNNAQKYKTRRQRLLKELEEKGHNFQEHNFHNKRKYFNDKDRYFKHKYSKEDFRDNVRRDDERKMRMPRHMHSDRERGRGYKFRNLAPELRFVKMLSLLDKDRNLIVGRYNSEPDKEKLHDLFKIESEDKKETYGWLAVRKPLQLTDPIDIFFIHQLRKSIFIIGTLTLFLAIIVSYLLSKHLLKPITSLMKGTKSISKREFKARISTKSKDELGKLANNFNKMAETLENFEEQRRQGISDISHEMGTPLSILQGEIEAIQDGIRKPTKENLQSLHNEVTHLGKIVKDLKDISLAETGGMSFNFYELSPCKILREVALSFKSQLENKQLNIELNILDQENRIKGDSDRLKQLFSNLISNSIRYTDSPGILKISSSVNNNQLLIILEDSVPAVPEESIPFLFDRLYRVDKTRNRAKGGSGLGLAICKHIVVNHDGNIKAEQSSLGGLKITISFNLNN